MAFNPSTLLYRTYKTPYVRTTFAHVVYHSLIALGIFSVFLFAIPPGEVNRYDEGLVLHGAAQVLDGAVPYRDFWTIYAPGQFWTLAGWFKLFGVSILSERIYDAVARTLLTLACSSAAWTITARRSPVVMTATFCIAWLWYTGFYGYPLIPASAAAIGACVSLVQWLKKEEKTTLLLLAGALATVASLFRHDIGAYTAITLLLGTALAGTRRRRAIPVLFGTMLASGLPALIYLLVEVSIHDLWAQLVAFPLTTYADMRALPFPSITEAVHEAVKQPVNPSLLSRAIVTGVLILPLPIAVYGLYLGLQGGGQANGIEANTCSGIRRFGVALMSLLTLFMFAKGVVRPSAIQMLPGILLAVSLICSWSIRSRVWTAAMTLFLAFLLLPPVIATFKALWHDGLAPHTAIGVFDARKTRPVDSIPRAHGFRLAEDQRHAIAYLRERTAPDTAIYVGKPRHDRLFVNDVLFYFLAERPPATQFTELHPGEVTTYATQAEMISALDRRAVTWVVTWRGAMHQEPNASARSSGVHILDKYLESHYQSVRQFGEYLILKRTNKK